MAEAATIPTSTPKELGKHLRAVRRRKGLSLSEVARGAGLSRRELVSYERGKVPIPESDLWVLAGSCGVDVSELALEHDPHELEAGPESIGDTIAFLRRGQQNGVGAGRAVRALEAADESAPQVQYSGPQAAPPPAPPQPEPTTAAPVDVFEELARLPEPVPLNNDPDDYADFLATPAFLAEDTSVEEATIDPAVAPPAGTFELIDDEPFLIPTAAVADLHVPEYAGFDAPMVVDSAPDTVDRQWTPADAPPIDVALRGETYATTGATATDSFTTGAPAIGDEGYDPLEPDPNGAAWTTDWQPDAQPAWESPDWESGTSGVWNEPDTAAGVPEWSDDAESVVEAPAWSPIAAFAPEAESGRAEHGAGEHGSDDDAPGDVITLTTYGDLRGRTPAQPEQWAHEPDPEATSTGFLVDWGVPEEPTAPGAEPAAHATFEPVVDETEPDAVEAFEPVDTFDTDDQIDTLATFDTDVTLDDPAPWEPVELQPTPDEVVEPEPGDVLAPIFWRPEEATVAPIEEPRPDEWITADDEWELGNALPLVEVRGHGALVMRRADERWALANLTVSDRYLLEVELEFRAGPGFGVLFRADVDEEGRMSAYSFDVDPVYEGGGYLVRQWQADRELWNPIAHVAADDPGAMYGDLTVRLEVVDERLVASVNNAVVMTVEDLAQRSVERGRNAPPGRRVGVQAWSSSDLVIETLRIADR